MKINKVVIYNIFQIIKNPFLAFGVLRNLIYVYSKLKKHPRFSIIKLVKAFTNFNSNLRLTVINGQIIGASVFSNLNSKKSAENFVTNFIATKGSGSNIDYDFKVPIVSNVAITEVCPYNCKHCLAGRRKDSKIMSKKDSIQLMKDLSATGISNIYLTGGEPLTHPNLPEIVASIDKDVNSFLYTTGHGFNEQYANKLKEAGLFGMCMSFESTSKKEMDDFCQFEGSYETAVKAIRQSLKSGFYTLALMMATKEKIESGELDRILRYLKKLGVHEAKVSQIMPSGKMLKFKKHKWFLDVKDQAKLKKLQIKANNDFKNYPKTQCLMYNELGMFGCPAGNLHFYIETGGEIYPCDIVEVSYGNVIKDGFRKAYKNMQSHFKTPSTYCFALTSQDRLMKIKGIPKVGYNEDDKFIIKDKRVPEFAKILFGG